MSATTGLLPVRDVPLGWGACTICDELVEQLSERLRRGQRPRLKVHGPRDARCTGSRTEMADWLTATRLPNWDDLSERDKGAALLHVWKRYWERSAPYAIEHYPVRYVDHADLLVLDRRVACRHAAVVTGGHCAIQDRLGAEEHMRLYDLALAEREQVAS